jgi:hypothetical protein
MFECVIVVRFEELEAYDEPQFRYQINKYDNEIFYRLDDVSIKAFWQIATKTSMDFSDYSCVIQADDVAIELLDDEEKIFDCFFCNGHYGEHVYIVSKNTNKIYQMKNL